MEEKLQLYGHGTKLDVLAQLAITKIGEKCQVTNPLLLKLLFIIQLSRWATNCGVQLMSLQNKKRNGKRKRKDT